MTDATVKAARPKGENAVSNTAVIICCALFALLVADGLVGGWGMLGAVAEFARSLGVAFPRG